MNKSWSFLISMILWASLLPCIGQDQSPKPITGAESFNLSPTEEKSLELKYSADHDASAAFRLSQYYGLARFDLDQQIIWLKRAAKLGHPAAQYNLAYILIETDKYKDRNSGKFWLDKAEESARKTNDSETLMLIPGLRSDWKKLKDQT